MPLKTGNPPTEAAQIVADSISDIIASPHPDLKSLAEAVEPPQPGTPLQIFTLGLEDMSDKDLAKAKETGWRYVVTSKNEAVAAAELNSYGDTVQFSHLNTGPFVQETVKAMAQATDLDAASDKEYEARILKIPALYVMALWMHNETDDILIPMPPTNENLEPNKPYSPAEFFDSLLPSAESRLAFDDSPQSDQMGAGEN